MLILSRKVSESLLIGDSICITILRCNRSGNVSIGIEAPREVPVLREELRPRNTPNNRVVTASSTSKSSCKLSTFLTRLMRRVICQIKS